MNILVTYTDEDLETYQGDTEEWKFANFAYHVKSTIKEGEESGIHLPEYTIKFEYGAKAFAERIINFLKD